MNRLPTLALGIFAFLISMLSLVFIVTNTGPQFDTVIINDQVYGETTSGMDTHSARFNTGPRPSGNLHHPFRLSRPCEVPMPVANGDKFAAIVFGKVRDVNLPALAQITNELSLESGMAIPLDETWTNWIGKAATEAFGNDSITLLAKRASANALVLDAESQELKRLVQSLLYGCCLVGIPSYRPEGLLLVGGVGPDGTEVRELTTLHTFYRARPAPQYRSTSIMRLQRGHTVRELTAFSQVPIRTASGEALTPGFTAYGRKIQIENCINLSGRSTEFCICPKAVHDARS